MNNRVIGFLCGSIFACNCLADASVKLNNVDRKQPIVINNDTSVLANNDYYVEILAGPVGGILQPISIAGTNVTSMRINSQGYFDGAIGIVKGVKENELADFQVRVWRSYPSYDMAYRAGYLTGVSRKWSQIVGTVKTVSTSNQAAQTLEIPSYIYYYGDTR